MKRSLLITTVLGLAFIAAARVAAEPASKPPAAVTGVAAHHDHAAVPAAPAEPAKAGMAMGKGMGGGMCPMMSGGGMGSMGGMGTMMAMGGADTQVTVKNTDTGVTITLAAKDPAKVARLQKMAEAVRLMHEATAQ